MAPFTPLAAAGNEASDALRPVVQLFKDLTTSVTNLGGSFKAFGAGFRAIGIDFDKIFDRLRQASGTVFGYFRNLLGEWASRTGVTLGPGIEAVKNFGTGFIKLTGAILNGVGAVSRFYGAVAGFLGGIADAGAQRLSGPMRVLDAGVSAVNTQIARFVKLYDPGSVFRFEYAVMSLHAAIGQAMAPALNAIVPVVKAISGAIAGTTEQGRTLIAAVAAGTVGLIAFGAAMALIESILTGGIGPIIGMIVGALGGMAVVSGALAPVLDTLSSTLSGLMGVMGSALASVSAVATGPLVKLLTFGATRGAAMAAYLADAFARMAPAIETGIESILTITEALQPLLELLTVGLVEGLVLLARAATLTIRPIAMMADAISGMVRDLVDLIRRAAAFVGINIPELFAPTGRTREGPPPVGGVRTTNIDEVLRGAREKAFMLGGGAEPPDVKIEKNTGSLLAEAAKVRKFIERIATFVETLASDILTGMGKLWREVAGVIRSLVQGVIDRILGLPEEVRKKMNELWDLISRWFQSQFQGIIAAFERPFYVLAATIVSMLKTILQALPAFPGKADANAALDRIDADAKAHIK